MALNPTDQDKRFGATRIEPNVDGTFLSKHPNGDKPVGEAAHAALRATHDGSGSSIGGGGGSVSPGQTLSLSGGSWEALASPQVYKQDDMQGTPGNDLVGWSLGSSHGVNPKYHDTNVWAGSTCARMDFTGGQYNCTAEDKGFDVSDNAYVSYRVNIRHLSGVDSRNIKLVRITGGTSYRPPSLGITLFDNTDSAQTYNYYENGSNNFEWMGIPPYDQWVRIEHYIRLSSTQGAADGKLLTIVDGVAEMSLDNVVTDNVSNDIEWITLPYYVAHDDGGDYEMLVSDVFINRGLGEARIEISNSPTYSAATAVPCDTSNRTSTSADIVVPVSNLDYGSALYAYVFDSDGTRHDYGVI